MYIELKPGWAITTDPWNWILQHPPGPKSKKPHGRNTYYPSLKQLLVAAVQFDAMDGGSDLLAVTERWERLAERIEGRIKAPAHR